MWVYEHEADEKVATTHCHLLIFGSERDAEGLKKLVSWTKSNIPKGNGGSSFKMYNKTYDILNAPNWYKALSYASKGRLQPKLAIGENADAIANESLANWREHETANVVESADGVANVRKSARVTQYQIARLAQAEYMSEFTESFMISEGCMQVKKLIRIIVKLLKANRMLAHKRIVAQIVSDIQADLNPDTFMRQVLSLV